jgi:hypothetical protein
MSNLEINGIPCISGSVHFPRVGRWTADLIVDTDEAITGLARLVSDDGVIDLAGTVQHGGAFASVVSVRVVGGTGGLDGSVTPAYYSTAPLRVPLQALLSQLGETLSPRSDQAVLGRFVASWTRVAGTGGTALETLAGIAGVDWRVLDDGTVWVGSDTYPIVTVDPVQVDLLHSRPAEDHVILSAEPIPPVRPGVTFQGRRVAYVEYRLLERGAELEVWYERVGSDSERALDALHAIIRNATHGTDYHALHRATVLSQGGDGTLVLRPESDLLPDMHGVRLAQIAPGIPAQVSGGTVLLAFEEGDPSRPVALAAWDGGSTISIPVKRCGTLSAVSSPSGGPVTFTYTAPDGTVQTGALVLLSGRITSI